MKLSLNFELTLTNLLKFKLLKDVNFKKRLLKIIGTIIGIVISIANGHRYWLSSPMRWVALAQHVRVEDFLGATQVLPRLPGIVAVVVILPLDEEQTSVAKRVSSIVIQFVIKDSLNLVALPTQNFVKFS